MPDSFDLTFHKCGAGPGNKVYVYLQDDLEIVVKDVSKEMELPPGYRAVLIFFGTAAWLYSFQSNQFPPQEPHLLINHQNQVSIQGAGKLVNLSESPLRARFPDMETLRSRRGVDVPPGDTADPETDEPADDNP